MKEVAESLRAAVAHALPLLNKITDSEASIKPAPEKWSKKEILGHLIDSAGNNQQKFVRLMEQEKLDFPGYAQNHWVDSQKYNAANWQDLIALWRAFNSHLAHVIENANSGLLQNQITISDAGTFTLEFIMQDYVEHLKHHLKQILPDAGITSNFQNLYNT